MQNLKLSEIRRRTELEEQRKLSPRGQLVSDSDGRSEPEDPDDVRTAYQVDRDRILHSPSFRRLKFKTQVFIQPIRDDTRTRLTHTLEVMQISRSIARALGLNEDLVEAITLGHDLGHTPFAHVGESVLDDLSGSGFHHSQQSVRIAEVLEKQGRGLNLTEEVKNGIHSHSKSTETISRPVSGREPTTEEGKVVRYCDSIAYINHDIEDAVNLGMLDESDLPESPLHLLGQSSGRRIETSVKDIIETSSKEGTVSMSGEVLEATDALRDFLFSNLYLAKSESEINLEAKAVMRDLFKFFQRHPEAIYEELPYLESVDSTRPVVDFLSLQSDLSIVKLYQRYLDGEVEQLPDYA